MIRGDRAREHEDASADGRPEADRRERHRPEDSLEPLAFTGRAPADGLYREELTPLGAHATSTPGWEIRRSVRVSFRNSAPMTAVRAATATGYQRPR